MVEHVGVPFLLVLVPLSDLFSAIAGCPGPLCLSPEGYKYPSGPPPDPYVSPTGTGGLGRGTGGNGSRHRLSNGLGAPSQSRTLCYPYRRDPYPYREGRVEWASETATRDVGPESAGLEVSGVPPETKKRVLVFPGLVRGFIPSIKGILCGDGRSKFLWTHSLTWGGGVRSFRDRVFFFVFDTSFNTNFVQIKN